MNRTYLVGGLLLGLTLVGMMPTVRAQARRASSGSASQQATIVAVHVIGSKRFVEPDIVAATGLSIGSSANPADFQNAANKLVATGAFDEVGYKYAPVGLGYNVTFNVTDSSSFVPVVFDNFVWFTDKELTDAIRKQVPLFDGSVSANGEMTDRVTQALQSIVAERGIPGEVQFLQKGRLGGAVDGGVFKIEGPTVQIREVKFPGAAEADLPALKDAAKSLLKISYQRTIVSEFAELNLRPIYRERGYLKPAFAEAETQLLDKSPIEPAVVVTIPVTPGKQYRVDEIRWSRNKAFGAQELMKAFKARPGAIANGVQLDRDVESAAGLYGTKGYLRAQVKAEPVFDDARNLVTYEMSVREGNVYTLKSMDITGMDAASDARLREAWSMREGETYNTSYEREYMKNIGPLLPRNVSIEVDKRINDKDHTVSVSMHLRTHANKVVK